MIPPVGTKWADTTAPLPPDTAIENRVVDTAPWRRMVIVLSIACGVTVLESWQQHVHGRWVTITTNESTSDLSNFDSTYQRLNDQGIVIGNRDPELIGTRMNGDPETALEHAGRCQYGARRFVDVEQDDDGMVRGVCVRCQWTTGPCGSRQRAEELVLMEHPDATAGRIAQDAAGRATVGRCRRSAGLSGSRK
jgi:hypothetical protein